LESIPGLLRSFKMPAQATWAGGIDSWALQSFVKNTVSGILPFYCSIAAGRIKWIGKEDGREHSKNNMKNS